MAVEAGVGGHGHWVVMVTLLGLKWRWRAMVIVAVVCGGDSSGDLVLVSAVRAVRTKGADGGRMEKGEREDEDEEVEEEGRGGGSVPPPTTTVAGQHRWHGNR